MNRDAREFFTQLLRTPGPTGSEQRVQRLVHDRVQSCAETVVPDVHGNLIFGVNTAAARKVVLAAHCDQIAFLVKHINEGGYLLVEDLGETDDGVLPGTNVEVHAADGAVSGVLVRKSFHQQSDEEKHKVPSSSDMWIDIGAAGRKDAERLVQVGDYATFRLGATDLANRRVAGAGLDNGAGLFVAVEALRRCAREKLDVALYLASTVQEELGMRGAQTVCDALKPDVALAIDATYATDDPGSPEDACCPCRLGEGPAISGGPNTNPHVARLLRQVATRRKIPYQPAPTGPLEGNDAQTMQISGNGVATASVGIPLRNMHTPVEVCSLDDLDHAVELVVEFVRSVRSDSEFRPFYDHEKDSSSSNGHHAPRGHRRPARRA